MAAQHQKATPLRFPQRLKRPVPPVDLLDPLAPPAFVPAPDLVEWALAVFVVDESSRLHNPIHRHLAQANLCALWTNVPNIAKQQRYAAQAEIPRPPVTGGPWARARWEQQLREWFGEKPDFVLTFDAGLLVGVEDLVFCATFEHELVHCAQALDAWGAPRFNRETGQPIYAIRGHDVEEHVEIVRRYGVDGGAGKTRELVEAAGQRPLIGRAAAALACGTCARRAA